MSQAAGEVSQTAGEVSQTPGEVSQTAGEVSQTVGEVSQTVGEVSQNVGEVSQAAVEVSQGVYSLKCVKTIFNSLQVANLTNNVLRCWCRICNIGEEGSEDLKGRNFSSGFSSVSL